MARRRADPELRERSSVSTTAAESTDEDLLVALQRLGRLMGSRTVSTRIARAAGGEVSQQGVQLLRSLLREGEQPIAGLATTAQMNISAVSRQLRPLEQEGFVVRSRDRDDGRVVLVSLSPEGARIATRIREVGEHHVASALSSWSTTERAHLARLMTRLVDDLQASEIDRRETT